MDLSVILQAVGIALGLLYLWLEYKANIWVWIVGAIMPLVHGTLYLTKGIYADAIMQLYYVFAGIYGLAVWLRKPKADGKDKHEGNIILWLPTELWRGLCVPIILLLGRRC